MIELFAGTTAKMMFYQADYSGTQDGDRRSNLKIRRVSLGLNEVKEDGSIQITQYEDGMVGEVRGFSVVTSDPTNVTQPLPFLPNLESSSDIRTVDFDDSNFAVNAGVLLETSVDLLNDRDWETSSTISGPS